MARHTSLKTVIDKNKLVGGGAFIVLMDVDICDQITGALIETIHFARNNEDITFEGVVYKAANFDFKTTQSSSEMPESTISVADLSGVLNKYIDESNGGDGWKIRLKTIAASDLSLPASGEEVMFVKGASINGFVISLSLGAQNPLNTRFPRRMQRRDRCAWVYKSEECGYTGIRKYCDYSLQGDNGCAAHNNTKRFGGFPGLRKR